jgi:hypothetical protein
MWDEMVAAAQAPALHWTVVATAVAAWIGALFSAGEAPLMGDMYSDELDG